MKTLSKKRPQYHNKLADTTIYDQLEDDGFYYQLIEGVLHVAPSPLRIHQKIINRLSHIFNTFLDSHPIGELYFAPFDVELNDKNIFQPDLLFVSKDRLSIITEKRVVGCPDLVIEILSESTKQLDLDSKYKTYEKSSVLEYWIVDPKKKSFSFYQLKEKIYKEIAVKEIYSSNVLKPLTFNLSDFWKKI